MSHSENDSPLSQRLPRRRFLASAASTMALASLPDWFRREAEAHAEATRAIQPRPFGPNDQIQIAVIGPGGSRGGYKQGSWVTEQAASKPGVKVVAVCDVDKVHRNEALAKFGGKTGGVTPYHDFRELLARRDIDGVLIGTPDHWHALIAIAAMRAGKDVYCEKPMTLTIAEGRKMAIVAQETNRIIQVGSQQRSDARFRLACELVRNGRLGKIKRVEVRLFTAPTGGPFPTKPVPADFDWEMWQGPAPRREYIVQRTHGDFRWWLDYSGGMITDWGAHHLDIAQWALGKDDSGPIRVRAMGETPHPDPTLHSYSVFPAYDITYTYAEGTTLLCTNKGDNGVRFEGENGRWIFVNREKIEASHPSLLKDPLPKNATRLYNCDFHEGNWIDSIRTRKPPICPVEVGHRSATVCHLGNIALQLQGRTLEWDPDREEFRNSQRANLMRFRQMHGPWKLD